MITANDDTFDAAVLRAGKPVLVDFSAKWCGPCKMQKPLLEQLSRERDDVSVVMVDVDESPRVTAKYGVQAMPTLMLFERGAVARTVQGLQNQKRLAALIDGDA
jgi:thioredoxin 1